MPYPPLGINTGTQKVSWIDVWMARFNCYCGCISHGIRGVIFGKLLACMPTVFRWKWHDDIQSNIRSFDNPTGTIKNSDLEMAGLLLFWLAMEGVCGHLQEKQIALFCDNFPSIGWVTCLASKWSLMAEHLVQALALHLKNPTRLPINSHTHQGQTECNFWHSLMVVWK